MKSISVCNMNCTYCIYYSKYADCCSYYEYTRIHRGCPAGSNYNKKVTQTEYKKKHNGIKYRPPIVFN